MTRGPSAGLYVYASLHSGWMLASAAWSRRRASGSALFAGLPRPGTVSASAMKVRHRVTSCVAGRRVHAGLALAALPAQFREVVRTASLC